MKTKIAILTLGFAFAAASFADGYGIAGSKNNNKVDAPLSQAANPSSTTQNNSSQVAEPAAISPEQDFGDTQASRQAFGGVVQNMMPMSPTQVKTLHKMFDETQRAASEFPGTPPRPTSSAILVSLSPGATPPIVRLRKGFVTSLVFLDSTGQPWPIQAYDLGNPNGFNIQWDKQSNTLLVQAMESYVSGNLAVILKAQNTPVMITLMPGQRAVDYRVDMRVPGLGPQAKPSSDGLPNTGTPQLITFLNGVPPNGAKELQINGGGDSQAWLYGGEIFVRTTMTLLSPGWISSMSSPDGTHVYEIMKAPVIIVSDQGAIKQLSIEGL